jgi:hypothetical protein
VFETFVGASKRVSNGADHYYRRARNRMMKKKGKKVDKTEDPDIIKLVKLFIFNGFKLNLHCISLLLSLNVHLDNLENYDIKYDEDLYFECFVNNCFPEEYMDKFQIDKNVIVMRRFTKNKIHTSSKLMEFIKTNNMVLDYYTVDAILNFNDNKLHEKVFIENNCVPSIFNKLHEKVFIENNCVPSIFTMYKKTNERCNVSILKKFIKQNNITKDMMMGKVDIQL